MNRDRDATTGWDDDIAAMPLSDVERDGMQMFRNYDRAFTKEAMRRFAAEVDGEASKFEDLGRVVSLLSLEEPRVLPMIACAYADEVLDGVFKRVIPDDVPGGRSSLVSGFGPLGSLAGRIKLAFAFEVVSRPILTDMNRLRSVRNRVAHEWDHGRLGDLYGRPPLSELHPIERDIVEQEIPREGIDALDPVSRFRVRAIWVIARLTYEAAYWARAKSARLNPTKALYGSNHPKALVTVSMFAKKETARIVSRHIPPPGSH